jgi:hypothetical protein
MSVSIIKKQDCLNTLQTLSLTADSVIEAGDTIHPAPSVVESTEPCLNPVTGCIESPPKTSTRPRPVYTTLTNFYSDLRTELAKVNDTLDSQRVDEIQGALGKWQRILADTSAVESYSPSAHVRAGSLPPARLLMRAQTALDTCATQFLALHALSMDGVDSVKKPTTTQGRAFWAGDASSGEFEPHLLRRHEMRLIRRRSLESVGPRDQSSKCHTLEFTSLEVYYCIYIGRSTTCTYRDRKQTDEVLHVYCTVRRAESDLTLTCSLVM